MSRKVAPEITHHLAAIEVAIVVADIVEAGNSSDRNVFVRQHGGVCYETGLDGGRLV